MNRHRGSLRVLGSVALGTALLGMAPAVAQEASPEVGWWTSNEIAGVPIGRALLVPPGGSQVASGADGAVSVSAVRFAAGPAGASYRVGIELGSDTEGVTVVACPAAAAWAPVHGAPLADAPAWDCERARAVGTVDADAGTISWDLPSAFVRDGVVDAMLLPPEASPAFTLTMAAPDAGSVTLLDEAQTSPPPTAEPTSPTPARGSGAGAPPAAPTAGPVPAPRRFPTPAPPATAPVGLPSPLPAAPRTAPAADGEIAAASSEAPSSTSGRVLGGLVLAGLLAGAAATARLAPNGDGADGRGVGRFVRARAEPPQAI